MKKGLFLLFCWVGLGGFFSETFGQIQRIDTIPSVKKGGIIGTIQDSTGYTIPMAHVFLIQGKDTVKLVSDLDGRFTYKGISSDTVRLWVSAVGYKPLEEDYIPSQHGLCIRVVLQEDIFSLDEVSVEAKNDKSMRFWQFTWQRIDAQDTMFFGIYDISLRDHLKPPYFPRYIDFYHPDNGYWYSEKKQAEIRELERKIIDLQRHKNEGLLENQSRIQALQKLITELKKQPDQALRTTAQAKGQTVREYRKETVQNLETVLKRLKEVNSQRYIDHQIRSSIERLSALRAHQSKVLDSQLVAERYKAKRWIASKMVDGKLHNYVGTMGIKRGLICVSRLKYHPLCQREIQAWGFVDYEVREVIPCQYGWAFNRLPLLCRHRWYTNTIIKFKSSPIPPWIEVPEPYRDSLGWITVGDFINQELMGMIDRENNVMIPLKFFWMEDRHEWIEFFYTPEGDFAPVTVKKEDKLLDGIIDRKGNFTLEPVYETPIFWDKKRHCFYTDREQGKEEEEEEKERIYFNAYGKEIKNTK